MLLKRWTFIRESGSSTILDPMSVTILLGFLYANLFIRMYLQVQYYNYKEQNHSSLRMLT